MAQFLYPLLAPQQFKAIFANLKKGKKMGQKANSLLNYRFEDYWIEPLSVVRARLGISQE